MCTLLKTEINYDNNELWLQLQRKESWQSLNDNLITGRVEKVEVLQGQPFPMETKILQTSFLVIQVHIYTRQRFIYVGGVGENRKCC
jgi:hypothetical protein